MAMDESYDNHYNFETTSYLTETSIDDTRRAEKPFEYSDAYFMVMGIPLNINERANALSFICYLITYKK